MTYADPNRTTPLAERYTPSGRVWPLGLVIAVIGGLIAGLLVGALVHFIGRFFYLIFAFPLLTGGLLFAIGILLIRVGKIRNNRIAILIALMMGITTYAAFRYGDYLYFRQIGREEMLAIALAEGLPEAEALEAVDEFEAEFIDGFLIDETGSGGFIGYILLEAAEGMTISRSGTEFNIGSFFTWLYWLFELGAIVTGAILGVRSQSNDLFCEAHERWYQAPERVGSIPIDRAESVLTHIATRNFVDAREGWVANPAEVGTPRLDVIITACEDCTECDAVVNVEQVQLDARGRTQTNGIFSMMITPNELRTLKKG